MAVQFNQGIVNKTILYWTTPAVTATPLTAFCWFNQSTSGDAALLALNTTTGSVDGSKFSMETFEHTPNQITANQIAGILDPDAQAVVSPFNNNEWTSACVIFASNSSRTAEVNAITGTAETTTVPTPSAQGTQIGGRILGSGSIFRAFPGCMAHMCIWNIVVPITSRIKLRAGTLLPLDVFPQNIALYAPLATAATKTNTFAWNGTALAPSTPLTYSAPAGSSITDCADAPPIVLSSATKRWLNLSGG